MKIPSSMTAKEVVDNELSCASAGVHERFRKTFGTILNIIELAVSDIGRATAIKELVGAELSSTEEACKKIISQL